MRTSKGLKKRTTYKQKAERVPLQNQEAGCRGGAERGWRDKPSLPAMPTTQTTESRGRNPSWSASSSDSFLTNQGFNMSSLSTSTPGEE